MAQTPEGPREVNVVFDAPICPPHHNVLANRRGRPAHSVFIHSYQFRRERGGGGGWAQRAASRFRGPKLIGGPLLWRKREDKEVSGRRVDSYIMRPEERVKETGEIR